MIAFWVISAVAVLVSVPAAVGGISDPCVANPANATCVSYQYPSEAAEKNVAMLCRMMPQMPVCSVKSAVCNSSQFQNSPACSPFGLWKIGCEGAPIPI